VQVLEAELAVNTVDTWTTRLAAVGVPAGRVGSIADAIELAERPGLEPTCPSAQRPHRRPATPSC
jgi:crotonobetainyl-CoA:carnitine CoA-transferase CaiB-like acyl-CoA transferase